MSAPDLAGLAELARALEGQPPEAILAAAAERFPGATALACSFGPEDCLLVDAIARARLLVRVFTLDTGYLFPETYALWRALEARYGIAVEGRSAGAAPADPAAAPPWRVDPDACCHARKVLPLREALAGLGAWVTGIRREQTPERARAQVVEWDGRFGLVKVNPLAAWTQAEVWERVRRRSVPTNPLHEQGYLSIGCAPCTSPVAPGEDPRAGRWRGREKTECGLHVDRFAKRPGP
ncbi:phosphoadenylyl-sulfate reductase [Anaeromyxobacter diazotrophicus]|uniref:Adenosine 5'-phosphosulfate reductase n=1 Tax=Anaeromyxobacter diazotrophicus TaxID=2590199 RepID=A0A7I9VRG7_9BACT|nr:phosphoadenylyl-sulfate reductase [Anaeromyxobacter diazotrophicus]GEJ58951.1 phosphoadenylyl-sulfate reductase (thioredoxin) [Anaeromyxobacter diazotrophicus]